MLTPTQVLAELQQQFTLGTPVFEGLDQENIMLSIDSINLNSIGITMVFVSYSAAWEMWQLEVKARGVHDTFEFDCQCGMKPKQLRDLIHKTSQVVAALRDVASLLNKRED